MKPALNQAVMHDRWRAPDGAVYSLVTAQIEDVSSLLASSAAIKEIRVNAETVAHMHGSLNPALQRVSEDPRKYRWKSLQPRFSQSNENTRVCHVEDYDAAGWVPGSIVGVPAGIIGFAASLAICIPLDIVSMPALLKRHSGDAMEGLLWCHLGIPAISWEFGYQVGAWPFLKAKEKIIFDQCDTGIAIGGEIVWDDAGKSK